MATQKKEKAKAEATILSLISIIKLDGKLIALNHKMIGREEARADKAEEDIKRLEKLVALRHSLLLAKRSNERIGFMIWVLLLGFSITAFNANLEMTASGLFALWTVWTGVSLFHLFSNKEL